MIKEENQRELPVASTRPQSMGQQAMGQQPSRQQTERVESELVAVVGLRRYRTWFESRVQFQLQPSGVLQLCISSSIERDCLQSQFAEEITEACRRAGIAQPCLVYEILESGPKSAAPSQAVPSQAVPSQAEASTQSADVPVPTDVEVAKHVVLPPQQAVSRETACNLQNQPAVKPTQSSSISSSFDSLVVGSSNQSAISIARQITAGQRIASPLLLWGATGVGKTQILQAIRDEIRQQKRRMRVVYLTGEQFTTGFVEAVHGRGLPAFRNKHRGVGLLLLDDLQFFAGKKKTLEELQHTLDALIAAGAQVVLASDRSPSELHALGGDIASRLSGGVNVEIRQPNHQMRRNLLQQLANKHSFTLEPVVMETLATGILGGARELSGAINRLRMESQLLGKVVGQELAQQIVDELNRQTTPEVKMKDIQSAICQQYDIDLATLRSGKRTKAATQPRMLAMWLSRKYTRAALSEIGDYYGRRSHSTVISACHRVDQLIGPEATETDAQMQEALRRVEATLRMA